jgi:UPF0271 protein
VRIEPLGDFALRFELPEGASARAAQAELRALPGVTDAVVAERAACVAFDVEPPSRDAIAAAIDRARSADPPRAIHVVRVRYDGADLAEIAARARLSIDEIVRLHTAPAYEVVAIGFLPGFAYLGGLDPRLELPRRASPRPRVPARSVAIAARYAGIYPFASPGGWHLVGTAERFAPFDPATGARLALGDRVRFEALP